MGMTAVYVTHDQAEAMALATRVAVMDKGRIVQYAPPIEIYRRPATTFVANFVGNPPMNLLPVQARVEDGRLHLTRRRPRRSGRCRCRRAAARSAGQHLTLGVRPEHCPSATPGAEHHPRPALRQREHGPGEARHRRAPRRRPVHRPHLHRRCDRARRRRRRSASTPGTSRFSTPRPATRRTRGA